jgi:hypothetical protein
MSYVNPLLVLEYAGEFTNQDESTYVVKYVDNIKARFKSVAVRVTAGGVESSATLPYVFDFYDVQGGTINTAKTALSRIGAATDTDQLRQAMSQELAGTTMWIEFDNASDLIQLCSLTVADVYLNYTWEMTLIGEKS